MVLTTEKCDILNILTFRRKAINSSKLYNTDFFLNLSTKKLFYQYSKN